MILHMHMSHTTTIAMTTLCSVHSTLKKKVRQANEKFSGFQEGAYRDGVKEKRQARDRIGSTLHDLADCETL